MKGLVTILAATLLICSCSKPTEEELRREEQEKLDAFLTKTTLTFYKAIKVAMKMSAVPSKDPEMAAAATAILKMGIRNASLAGDSTESISLTELITMTQDFYAARDILSTKNEDDLPTVLDNIRVIYGAPSPPQPLVFGNITYDNNFEHAILGLLWTASTKAPLEFALYELHKVEEAKVASPYISLMTELSKALTYSNNGFPWHALDQSAGYISNLEKNKPYLQPYMVSLTSESTAEQRYYQHHLLGVALHGLAHLELEHDGEAMMDFETVLEDAEKGGLDNELVWLIGAYVNIKNEDFEKAIAALEKLERSNLIGESERVAIHETKEYLISRESGKAFNNIRDKIAVSRICFKLTMSRLKELEQVKQLHATAEGKSMVEIQEKIESNSSFIDKISGLNADSLALKTKSALKGLLGN